MSTMNHRATIMTYKLKLLNNSFQKRMEAITDSGSFRLCSLLRVLTKGTALVFIAPHVNCNAIISSFKLCLLFLVSLNVPAALQ